MYLIDAQNISKTFRIPSAHRDTIREHFFGMFSPRRFEDLHVLRDIRFGTAQDALGLRDRARPR